MRIRGPTVVLARQTPLVQLYRRNATFRSLLHWVLTLLSFVYSPPPERRDISAHHYLAAVLVTVITVRGINQGPEDRTIAPLCMSFSSIVRSIGYREYWGCRELLIIKLRGSQ